MDREDIQSRRAANQVWNGAENYDVRPEFQSYDSDGEAQLYFNTIIGLVYRYYQFDRFKPLFHTFQHQPKGELYSGLFWLGLEGAAYRRALPDRPVLQELRQDYARRVVKEAHAADPQSAESLHAAWFRRALGQPEQEDAWQKDVLDALTAAGIARMGLWTLWDVPCTYPLLERMKLEVAATGGVVRDAEYGADITLRTAFPAGAAETFQLRLTELSAGSLTMTAAGEEFLPGPREEAN